MGVSVLDDVETDLGPVTTRSGGNVGRRVFDDVEDADDRDAAARVFADVVLRDAKGVCGGSSRRTDGVVRYGLQTKGSRLTSHWLRRTRTRLSLPALSETTLPRNAVPSDTSVVA